MKQSTLLGLILMLAGFMAWFYLTITPVRDAWAFMPALFGGLMFFAGFGLLKHPAIFHEEEE